jgi:hypothetical protein
MSAIVTQTSIEEKYEKCCRVLKDVSPAELLSIDTPYYPYLINGKLAWGVCAKDVLLDKYLVYFNVDEKYQLLTDQVFLNQVLPNIALHYPTDTVQLTCLIELLRSEKKQFHSVLDIQNALALLKYRPGLFRWFFGANENTVIPPWLALYVSVQIFIAVIGLRYLRGESRQMTARARATDDLRAAVAPAEAADADAKRTVPRPSQTHWSRHYGQHGVRTRTH